MIKLYIIVGEEWEVKHLDVCCTCVASLSSAFLQWKWCGAVWRASNSSCSSRSFCRSFSPITIARITGNWIDIGCRLESHIVVLIAVDDGDSVCVCLEHIGRCGYYRQTMNRHRTVENGYGTEPEAGDNTNNYSTCSRMDRE